MADLEISGANNSAESLSIRYADDWERLGAEILKQQLQYEIIQV